MTEHAIRTTSLAYSLALRYAAWQLGLNSRLVWEGDHYHFYCVCAPAWFKTLRCDSAAIIKKGEGKTRQVMRAAGKGVSDAATADGAHAPARD